MVRLRISNCIFFLILLYLLGVSSFLSRVHCGLLPDDKLMNSGGGILAYWPADWQLQSRPPLNSFNFSQTSRQASCILWTAGAQTAASHRRIKCTKIASSLLLLSLGLLMFGIRCSSGDNIFFSFVTAILRWSLKYSLRSICRPRHLMLWKRLITLHYSATFSTFILYFEVNDISSHLSTARSRAAVSIQSATAHSAPLIRTSKSKGSVVLANTRVSSV